MTPEVHLVAYREWKLQKSGIGVLMVAEYIINEGDKLRRSS